MRTGCCGLLVSHLLLPLLPGLMTAEQRKLMRQQMLLDLPVPLPVHQYCHKCVSIARNHRVYARTMQPANLPSSDLLT